MKKKYVKQQREIVSGEGVDLRLCSHCLQYLPHDQFYTKKDGLSYVCIPCERSRGGVENPHRTARQIGVKTCRKCLIEKPVSEFQEHTVHGKRHGFQSWCRDCCRKVAGTKRTMIDVHLGAENKRRAKGDEVNARREKRQNDRIDKLEGIFYKKHAHKWFSMITRFAKTKCKRCVDCGELTRSRSSRCDPCRKDHTRKQLLENSRQYMKNHPDKRRDKERKREIRKRQIPGFHTEKEWIALVESCDYTCVFCGNKFSINELTRDHIIPITIEGSTDYIQNIQPACVSCNSKKGNRESIDRRPKSV